MDLSVPREVLDFARSARQILADPNLEGARRAMDGDEDARAQGRSRLDQLGVDDLGDPADDEASALAAAHVALEAGRVVAPIPVVQRLTAHAAGLPGLLHAVGSPAGDLFVDHALFPGEHAAVTIDGSLHPVKVTGPARPQRQLAPFAARIELGDAETGSVSWWCWHEIFAGFHAAGVITTAVDLYISHSRDRVQFGKPLASFQSVQQRLAEIMVLRDGVTELAHWALWTIRTATDDRQALATALALRSYQLEAAAVVLLASQQIHGAAGVCYEYPQAVLQRSRQVSRHVPLSQGAARSLLADHVHLLPRLVSFGSTSGEAR